MHYYKRNIGDYSKKAARLSMLQHGAYTLLMDACYDREIFPTEAEALEWTWASTNDEIEAVQFVLRRFFVLQQDGRYVQERIVEELANYHGKAETNKRIALEREANRREKSTNRARPVHEAPPNQEPLTKNHQPLFPDADASVPAKQARLPACPVDELIAVYHAELPTLPKARLKTKGREKLLQTTWRWVLTTNKPDGSPRATSAAEAVEWFRLYFRRATANDFLMGRTKRADGHQNWKPDLDFLLTERGMKHVMERTE